MNKKQKKLAKRIYIAGGIFILLNILPLILSGIFQGDLGGAADIGGMDMSVGMDGYRFPAIAIDWQFVSGCVTLVLYLVAYLIVGKDILRKAFKGMCNGRMFDENFLMALATVGAIGLAFYENIRDNGGLDLRQTLDLNEAVAVMLFYQIGELFQGVAVGRSRKNIAALMDIRPDYANLEQGDKVSKVDPDEVSVGSMIYVYPGEKIPLDGMVVAGSSSLNTSALTGESLPRDVVEGEEVISGCINLTGVLKIRTTKAFGQSTVSKILELVEEASSRKSKSEQFISKFARVYTPAVTLSALALAVLPPMVRLIMGMEGMWAEWIYRALTFLVISCPCALVISIPLTFFAGIGGAGKAGILVKGSNYLEALSKASVVVFDKTGTLTRGSFVVKEILLPGTNYDGDGENIEKTDADEAMSEESVQKLRKTQVLEYAALAESASSHPISKSLLTAYGKPIKKGVVFDIQEISGHGVVARVARNVSGEKTSIQQEMIQEEVKQTGTAQLETVQVAAGNAKWMTECGVTVPAVEAAGTLVYVAVDGKYAGCIVISDVEKTGAKEAIASLKKSGVKQTVMLTGDAEPVARQVADSLCIDTFRSGLLPADKVAEVERLLETPMAKNGALIFVGDGINDAPVLSRADIGIAMGALGSDAAIEAADVVLMDDDPRKIATAIAMARRVMGIVYQNIVFSLAVKFACLGLGAFGVANMWFAIFADVGVMVIAVLNAIRALKWKEPN